MVLQKIQASGPTSPEITQRRLSQPLTWALLITLALIFGIWGVTQTFPYNIILWFLSILCIVILVILFIRGLRGVPKLKALEVRRLIVCQKCGVESEGPYESGDFVFRTIGPCPRCGGTLHIKALYSIDTKTPLKRQQPRDEKEHATSKD